MWHFLISFGVRENRRIGLIKLALMSRSQGALPGSSWVDCLHEQQQMSACKKALLRALVLSVLGSRGPGEAKID